MKGNLLGSLESRIMEYFWNLPKEQSPKAGNKLANDYFWQNDCQSSIAQLHQNLNKKDSLAYTTVATVTNRLVDKGLLLRSKKNSGYIYTCRQSKEQFMKGRSRSMIKILLGDFGDLAVAGFVEELKGNPEALRKLKELSRE
jgi:predicted transcriptional regulator